MKQRRHGKKVYNWHRPLGRNELRRRFLRGRDTANTVTKQIVEFSDTTDLSDLNIWPYEISNYCCESCYENSRGYADGDDKSEHALKATLDALLHPSAWHTGLDHAKAKFAPPSESSTFPQVQPSPIEKRLAKHLDEIQYFGSDPELLLSTLGPITQSSLSLDIISSASNEIGTPHFARLLLLFSPFWLQEPTTWNNNKDPFDLLRFLFTKHEVPGFLFPTWLSSNNLHEAHLKWLLWFIIIGQGGSLKRASKYFPWAISGKYQHHLNEAPKHFNPRDASLLAEVKRLGGTLTTHHRLARSHYFTFDPSEDNYRYRSFWEDTLNWLRKNEDALNDEECGDILQWAIHKHTEGERGLAEKFTWKNRSLAACRERADRYFTSLNQPSISRHWKSKGWGLEFTDDDNTSWSITELTSAAALAKEGQTMRHCVASYAIRCQSGYSAIFSLKKNTHHCITIEVDLRKRQIVQARGKFNRSANDKENTAIAHWFSRISMDAQSSP